MNSLATFPNGNQSAWLDIGRLGSLYLLLALIMVPSGLLTGFALSTCALSVILVGSFTGGYAVTRGFHPGAQARGLLVMAAGAVLVGAGYLTGMLP